MTDPDPRTDAEVTREALIAGLAASASDLSSVARDLYKSAVLTKIERTVITLAVAALVVLGIIEVVGVVKLNGIAKTNERNTNVIRDCTQPDGVCFKDSQKRTADVIDLINQVTVAAAYCAKQPDNDTEAEIKSCIDVALTN